MNRIYLKKHINMFSIILFLVLFFLLNYLKPSFLYNKDGSLRQFGVGNNKKTIVPIWLLSIILGILSYLIMMFYVNLPKLK